MRRAAVLLVMMSMFLAGCATPFNQYPTIDLPTVRATFEVRAYDSDADGLSDGISLRLLSATPQPPLVGSDVVIERNGDTNVTVWRCPQREERLCQGGGNRGILSWDVSETIYIRGLPGPNRLDLKVRERFEYNTTVLVQQTRDTEVWAVLDVRPYDSDGNRTADGIEISLINSDKAPFPAEQVRVLINKVDVPVFREPRRLAPFTGLWERGTKVFVDGFIGENEVTVVVLATEYRTGTYLIGE